MVSLRLNISTGDAREFAVQLEKDGVEFTPNPSTGAIIVTVKNSYEDADADSVFQKASGAGVTLSGSVATLSILRADSIALEVKPYYVEFLWQDAASGLSQPVAAGILEVDQRLTRGQQTAVDVITTDEPLPFGGGGGGSFETITGDPAENESLAAALETAGVSGILSSVTVNASGSDLDRGSALIAARATARLLTPNGSARSATNRVSVIIPPGAYKVAASFGMSDEFIDYIAQSPQNGGNRLASDNDDAGGSPTPLAQFRPPNTYIYSDESAAPFAVVTQSAANIRLTGFGIAQLGEYGAFDFGSAHAFHVDLTSDASNSDSIYDLMYFFHRVPNMIDLGSGPNLPVSHAKHVAGTWRNCISNSFGWRCGGDGVFSASMTDCQFGPFSVGGDLAGASFGACRLERCVGVGDSGSEGISGYACFGGCAVNGIPAIASSVFVECEAGERSFNVGTTAGGTYIRCRGGRLSFGATYFDTFPGIFSGYAEDCIAGADSFGGTSVAGYGKMSGVVLRCAGGPSVNATRLEGATIRDSRFSNATSGTDLFTLLDSNSSISNSDLLVNPARRQARRRMNPRAISRGRSFSKIPSPSR